MLKKEKDLVYHTNLITLCIWKLQRSGVTLHPHPWTEYGYYFCWFQNPRHKREFWKVKSVEHCSSY